MQNDNHSTDPNVDNQDATTVVDSTDPNTDNQLSALPPNFKSVDALVQSYNESRKTLEKQAKIIKTLAGDDSAIDEVEDEDEKIKEALRSHGFLTREDLEAQKARENSLAQALNMPGAAHFQGIFDDLVKANPGKNPMDIYAEKIAPLVKNMSEADKISAAKAGIRYPAGTTSDISDVDPRGMSTDEYAKWHAEQLKNSKRSRLIKRPN